MAARIHPSAMNLAPSLLPRSSVLPSFTIIPISPTTIGSFSFSRNHHHRHHCPYHSARPTHQRLLVTTTIRSCLPSSDNGGSDADPIEKKDISSQPSSTFSSPPSPSSSSSSSYGWSAAIGAVGFVETSYLTYLKVTGSDAFCPIGGGSCSTVLNSEYGSVFGVPLPAFGMIAYGLVALLGLQLARKGSLFALGEASAQLVLLGSATSMAAASSYFLYILSTKFSGMSCSYCLFSAFLSFSLLFINMKFQELQKTAGLQLSVAGLVIAAVSASYSGVSSELTGSSEINLQLFEPEITNQSSPEAISLAKHLKAIGAKMYGAFWCSHCLEQKEMFGKEAAKMLNYIECFPDGYRKGVKPAKACQEADIEGFPTWIINGQVLSGELELSELAEASGFLPEATNEAQTQN
ncbi:thiol-disulfide oxidoreductase LTO1 [Nymphaea colorata]|uniref:thiol-disulfide oxidoreductase LTO1 n=1 Tax=Nymphaea colorata TaxID=210225 RepID=UPI00129DDD11|nr:thiol-disulfide oxidoreductase LTO1 [Nymphaea colorata]XP_031476563.1 thiol-disulfide oxidoreductase LTO1 [Nymphaea colorata]